MNDEIVERRPVSFQYTDWFTAYYLVKDEIIAEPVVAFAVVQCRVVAKAGDRAVWPEREWNEISAYTVNPDGGGDLIPAQDTTLLGVVRTPSGADIIPSRIEDAAKARGASA